jgi:hypothetical protein
MKSPVFPFIAYGLLIASQLKAQQEEPIMPA